MTWKKKALENFTLYLVTDLTHLNKGRIVSIVEKAIDGGVDIVQLRSKELMDSELLAIGRKMRAICRQKRRLFFVNDRPDLAIVLDADGVHVGQDDLPVSVIRRLFAREGKERLIGKSTHSFTQAKKTAQEAVDYIGVGPIFKTPTKKDYIPVGLDLITKVSHTITLPFVCIGGITKDNLTQVREAGGQRIAIVRAVCEADNPKQAAAVLKKQLKCGA